MKSSQLKNKVGGQKGNKNAEKWTEEAALKIVNDLIKWLKPDVVGEMDQNEANIFVKDFLLFHTEGITRNQIQKLRKKYESFDALYARAREMQEVKLIKLGIGDRTNAQLTKLFLVNNHGYRDKIEHAGDKDNPVTFKQVILNPIKPDGADEQTS